MNLVVLVIDTLRRDYLGTYGNDWIETPNMDRLAAGSTVFDFSFTHSYPTIPHRTDMLTGEYGGPFHPWMPLRHDRTTFVEQLGRAGWCTQLIHDTPHLVNGGHNFDWPFHAWTPVRGAEVDRPWLDDSTEWPDNWGQDPRFEFADLDSVATSHMCQTYARANRQRRAHEHWNCARLFLTASEWLEDNRSRNNFVLWIDCFDPHEPWDVPPEFMLKYDKRAGYDGRIDPRGFIARNDEAMSDDACQHIAARYAAKVSWVDHWLGGFLNTLDETGLADRTAVLLTADHGTNVGERGRFGKGYPVREQEARTPFMVRVPDLAPARSNAIVQPQDVFATVLALLGQPAPLHLDSHDVLALAQNADSGPRQLALAGGRADAWKGDTERTLFSAFDREWCLEIAAEPEHDRLTRFGTLKDVAGDNSAIVAAMRDAAIDELALHGAHPALVTWLRNGGTGPWPQNIPFWDGYPGPACFHSYFGRIYSGI